ncbi:penicillin-binding protein 1A [Azospirillum sp. YIM DDC1]|uniref:Penicillin-binding protein 1A n=1 Tax=Azospirillum aestuarii TaxID=2802052 RepID=A0ABS1I2C3_9PROT|nr:penicillin-binding protein 1A [Azospirillum aestuarii]MBK3776816.1 PBP1A family penicillin-binding protein [Azospirillum brasilense]MBK4721255.1 penicillin-binding protein 1A [Azospirillum aestuarii]
MRFILSALMAVVILALAGAGGLVYMLDHYDHELPDYTKLANYEPPVTTRVHAGDGRLLAEFASEKRVFVPIDAMPKRVTNAFLSAEDKNFYDHKGIDPVGIARAILTNVENLGRDRRPMGASTITQQVAKNMLLTNEVSFSRKIKEAILAVRIERAFSKDRILELYLNEIFLGYRSYGVAAAALNYFNKALDELDIEEAAYLAALPKAPSNYHPERQRDAAMARRNWVIGRMAEDGHITPEEAKIAQSKPLVVRKREEQEYVTSEYFAEEVRRELVKLYGEQALYEGGLSVRASMDPVLQQAATRALRAGLVQYDRRHGYRGPVGKMENFDNWAKKLASMAPPAGSEGWHLAVVLKDDEAAALDIGLPDGSRGRVPLAELRWARAQRDDNRLGPEIRRPSDVAKLGDLILVEAAGKDDKGKEPPAGTYALRQVPAVQGGLVALDPHTGRVLAMVGGFSPQMSSFNRATQAMRQPGSSFKPFVYLTALNQGFTPSSLVMDAPFEYDPGHGQPIWRPENYSHEFYGPTPLRAGIEKSRNVMTVRLAQAVGMDKVKALSENFGITDNLQPYLPMSLGAGETTVLRLATAYAMLANGGKRVSPTFIDRVQDRNGKTVFRHDTRPCASCNQVAWSDGLTVPAVADTREQVNDPRTVYQMVSMLEGVVQRGTATKLLSLGKPLAGKTGTTNDSHDAWFMGFSPDLVVGTYIGFDQPRSLGAKETGGSAAVPVFKDVMEVALKDHPATPFRVPRGLRLVRVNPENGRLAQPGERKAIWEAFIPGTEPNPDQPQMVLDGSAHAADGGWTGGVPGGDPAAQQQPSGWGAPAAPPSAATVGTGGLY